MTRAPFAAALALLLGGCSVRHDAGRPGHATVPRPGDSAAVADTATQRPATSDTGSTSAAPRPGIDPSTAVRFEIVGVDDSTFAFLAPRASWLRPGMRGIVVDPRRRDVLVARFKVLTLQADTAAALVTGQTTRLVTDHVALVPRPIEMPTPVPTRRVRTKFWSGALVGGVLGLLAGLMLR